MINYYLDSNIRIKKIANYDKIIKNFKINKKEGYIKINYMCGKEETVPYMREKVEVLDLLQQQQFEQMKKTVYPKLNRRKVVVGSAVAASAGISVANLVIGNPLIAAACLSSTTGGVMQTRCFKLKRELDLISWINTHRSEINQLIKEEVESVTPIEDMNIRWINPIVKNYPTDKTDYPEDMYYYGINLSNIDEVGLNELRKIKRKVKKRIRQEKRK